ncbi:MAG TPA: PIG-L family deacetylase [Nakamurella sp.]
MATDTSGDLGSILGVWGHPDDEAYLSAGLMALAVDAGRRVVCVTATRGEAGFPANDPRSVDERKTLRQAELAACLAVLGVTEHRYLGYPDGGCAQVPDEEAVGTIAEIIAELRPATVLTFGPDGGTGHQDHIAACRWASLAFDRAAHTGSRLLYATKTKQWGERFYAGVDPDDIMMVKGMQPESLDPSELAVWLTCDEPMVTRKVEALRSQASQIEPFRRAIGDEAFRELVREEFFRDRRPGDAALIEQHTRR